MQKYMLQIKNQTADCSNANQTEYFTESVETFTSQIPY